MFKPPGTSDCNPHPCPRIHFSSQQTSLLDSLSVILELCARDAEVGKTDRGPAPMDHQLAHQQNCQIMIEVRKKNRTGRGRKYQGWSGIGEVMLHRDPKQVRATLCKKLEKKRILGRGHSTHKGPEVGMCLTGSSRAQGREVSEGQTQAGREQGDLWLQGEGWRGNMSQRPPTWGPHVCLITSLCFLAPPS